MTREEALIVNILRSYEIDPAIIHDRANTREACASIRSFLMDAMRPTHEFCEAAGKFVQSAQFKVNGDDHSLMYAFYLRKAYESWKILPFRDRTVTEWTGVDSKPEYDRLQQAVGEWGKATFPKSTPDTITLHMLREARELVQALEDWEQRQLPACPNVVWPTVIGEVAGILLLALGLAHRSRFSLFSSIEQTFQEVQSRKWGEPDEQGVSEHIRSSDSSGRYGITDLSYSSDGSAPSDHKETTNDL